LPDKPTVITRPSQQKMVCFYKMRVLENALLLACREICGDDITAISAKYEEIYQTARQMTKPDFTEDADA